MLISKVWLNEWVNSSLDAEHLGQRLTSVGLELAAIEPAGPVLSKKIISGQVESVEPHPRADRLQICRVYVGRKRLLQIVCGASNVRPGLPVVVALIGAKLPGGMVIKKTRIRDVISSGMLCSVAELGLEDKSTGIMELDAGTPVGRYLGEVLKLNDKILEVDLTPNRGDCLSISGMAREVSAFTGTKIKGPTVTAVHAQIHDKPVIRLQAGASCPRYVGRIIKNIDVEARTPVWMMERLRRSGVRPVSAIVDITNYVMLELGQPMHAFDNDLLSGDVVVRNAEQDEVLELLTGDHVVIDRDVLVIANNDKAVALAGIMGGQRTAISDATSNILLEAAFFAPEVIVGRARRYGLQTDSSFRFERGVDPELPVTAMQRATRLILEIAGGRPGPLIEAVNKSALPVRTTVGLRRRKLLRVLGCELPDDTVRNYLLRLGLRVRKTSSGWRVAVPSHRFDIACEEDLIEEVARSYGYERIPVNPPRGSGHPVNATETLLRAGRIDDLMMDLGYQEVITYSFVDAQMQHRLDPEHRAVELTNPIATNMSVMRTSLWPGLLSALANNLNRQHARVRLFETGRCFRPQQPGTLADESVRLAGVICGPLFPKHWDENARPLDFFDIKGNVESLSALTGASESFEYSAARHAALHPGRSARICYLGQPVGYLGQLHPAMQQWLDINEPVYLFELEMDSITAVPLPVYQSFSRFPETRRDLAIVVTVDISASRVLNIARSAAGPLLKKLEIFDDYRGKNIPNNKKSLAFGLTLQHSSRTLTDTEVEEVVRSVMAALSQQLGATLR